MSVAIFSPNGKNFVHFMSMFVQKPFFLTHSRVAAIRRQSLDFSKNMIAANISTCLCWGGSLVTLGALVIDHAILWVIGNTCVCEQDPMAE